MSIAQNAGRLLLLTLAVALVLPAWGAEDPADDAAPVLGPEVRVRSQVPPYYPATASLTGADAVVVLAAQVGADGKIADLEVVDCNRPDFGFEDAAAGAVRHWKFKPATKDGQAVASETFVTLYIGPPSKGRFGGEAFTRTSFATAPPQARLKRPGDGGAGGGPTTAGDPREELYVAERPNCTPGERCIYDRNQLNQRSRPVQMPSPAPNKSRISRAAGSR